MLKEIKTDWSHYFIDAQGRYQGEYKEWYGNGNMWMHCFYVDGKLHGERKYWDPEGNICTHCFDVDGKLHGEHKWWNKDGTLVSHRFYIDDQVYRDLLVNPVDNKDKFLITIETGGKWLC